jgi:hypothetical protein
MKHERKEIKRDENEQKPEHPPIKKKENSNSAEMGTKNSRT